MYFFVGFLFFFGELVIDDFLGFSKALILFNTPQSSQKLQVGFSFLRLFCRFSGFCGFDSCKTSKTESHRMCSSHAGAPLKGRFILKRSYTSKHLLNSLGLSPSVSLPKKGLHLFGLVFF